uniref:Fatty acyl-CoA reductase n=1 Tax=Timema tahoe TaxID=61484 RepID=A0A7R9P084_9NEOP|nr:unnamed protein product [Timema tahoe]
MVYVSTAYCNCPLKEIKECFYDPPLDAEEDINYLSTTDEAVLEVLKYKILGEWPNTYTFTKSIAEDIIRKNASDLPISIVRPSQVRGVRRSFRGMREELGERTFLRRPLSEECGRGTVCSQEIGKGRRSYALCDWAASQWSYSMLCARPERMLTSGAVDRMPIKKLLRPVPFSWMQTVRRPHPSLSGCWKKVRAPCYSPIPREECLTPWTARQ